MLPRDDKTGFGRLHSSSRPLTTVHGPEGRDKSRPYELFNYFSDFIRKGGNPNGKHLAMLWYSMVHYECLDERLTVVADAS